MITSPSCLHSTLLAVTDIGDSAVISAMVIISSLYLWLRGCRQGAQALLLALALTSAIMALVKIGFMGCGAYFRPLGIRSPSGHTALSMAVFLTYAMLLGGQLRGHRRWLPLLFLVPLALAIAATRVALGFHSLPEVLIGLLSGLLTAGIVRHLLRRSGPVPPFPVFGLALSALIPALLLHGTRLPAESLIDLIAAHFRHYVHCR